MRQLPNGNVCGHCGGFYLNCMRDWDLLWVHGSQFHWNLYLLFCWNLFCGRWS
jgi:hypothetical protein